MNFRMSLLAWAVLGSVASSSFAATIVVPPDLPETGGVSTAIRSLPRTYMALYTSVNFASLTVPTLITGLQFRLSEVGNEALPATWPSVNLNFTNFDIKLSQASASLLADGEFLSSSVTFASQQAGTVTTVRSGALTIPTASFQNTGGTNPFGYLINFTTPYLYTPGQSLLLYLTHTGYNPSTEPQPFFASTDFQNGVTDAISSTVGYQAASASGFSSPYIVQFTTAAVVPEPSTWLMLAGGVAGLLALQRRRSPAQA